MSTTQVRASTGLHIFTDDAEYVIATDAADAKAAYRESGGEHPAEIDFEQMPDERQFTLYVGDGPAEGTITKTCAEWAAERGRGYFCASIDQ